MEEPSTDGCAHVGEQETSPGLGGSIPWPPMSRCFMPLMPAISAGFALAATGAPFMPSSFPFVKRKWRETFSVWVSISTSMSSIMHAE